MTTDNPDASAIVTELSQEAKLKLEIIESLLDPCDRSSYEQRLKDAAKKLGKSVRTVQRLVQERGTMLKYLYNIHPGSC